MVMDTELLGSRSETDRDRAVRMLDGAVFDAVPKQALERALEPVGVSLDAAALSTTSGASVDDIAVTHPFGHGVPRQRGQVEQPDAGDDSQRRAGVFGVYHVYAVTAAERSAEDEKRAESGCNCHAVPIGRLALGFDSSSDYSLVLPAASAPIPGGNGAISPS